MNSHGFCVLEEAVVRQIVAEEVVRALQPIARLLSERDLEPPPPLAPGLITSAEVAALLGVNLRTIRRLVLMSGDFPSPVKIGRRAVRFRREDVEAYIRRERAG